MNEDVMRAITAVGAEEVVVIPTDTVYGLACTAFAATPLRALYDLKGRPASQPTALVTASVEALLECVPELRGRSGTAAGALLPGPFTLVLPNPARRFGWLCGDRPDAIGVRVPLLDGPGREVLAAVDAVAATSANLAGGPDPRCLDEVPVEIRSAVSAVVDGGDLPGTPSTVLDLTGDQPVVLREGAVPAAEALARVAAALAG